MRTYQDRAASAKENSTHGSNNHILDDQTVFYVFKKLINKEYGTRGEQNIEARYYKDKKLFVAARNSLWMSELRLNRAHLVDALNQELGSEGVVELKVESNIS